MFVWYTIKKKESAGQLVSSDSKSLTRDQVFWDEDQTLNMYIINYIFLLHKSFSLCQCIFVFQFSSFYKSETLSKQRGKTRIFMLWIFFISFYFLSDSCVQMPVQPHLPNYFCSLKLTLLTA